MDKHGGKLPNGNPEYSRAQAEKPPPPGRQFRRHTTLFHLSGIVEIVRGELAAHGLGILFKQDGEVRRKLILHVAAGQKGDIALWKRFFGHLCGNDVVVSHQFGCSVVLVPSHR